MRVLIISPVATHPINQGNSARIARICSLFRYYGYRVHLLYYGLEGLSEPQRRAMEREWDHFHFVAPTPNRQTRPDGYAIDDFYGAEIDAEIDALKARWDFDVVFCNYVWMSAALERFGPASFKVIDTHDVFGDRQYRLQEQGVAPAWFFTSIGEETRGLARADLVVAIQEAEARDLESRTDREILTIGHVLPANFVAPTARPDSRLRVGYLASNNPSNRISLQGFLTETRSHPEMAADVEFRIGGAISNSIPGATRNVTRVGFVDDARHFYRSVDVVVNPNTSGTGLKIKSVEALSFGVPIVSTVDGMVGIDTEEPGHLCESLSEVCEELLRLREPGRLAAARETARSVFQAYAASQTAGFQSMLDRAASFAHGRS